MSDGKSEDLARSLLSCCAQNGLRVATAESCTGGLVAVAITDIPGASRIFERGFVVYSNEAKEDLLGVSRQSLRLYGAVSREVALEMAAGALSRSKAEIAVSVTGIAGPDGGGPEKPVGLVHFACARRGGAVIHAERRFGALSRAEIRDKAKDQALLMLLDSARRQP
jgi:nicotinamide-nucleotide amidase